MRARDLDQVTFHCWGRFLNPTRMTLWKPTSKMASNPPCLVISTLLCSCLPYSVRIGLCQPIEYGESDGMWFARLGHKRHCRFCLGVSLGSLSLEMGSHHVRRKPKQLYREDCVMRNWDLSPVVNKELRLAKLCEWTILESNPRDGHRPGQPLD